MTKSDFDAKLGQALETFVLNLHSFQKESPTKPVDIIYAEAHSAIKALVVASRPKLNGTYREEYIKGWKAYDDLMQETFGARHGK